ncbi:MAG TPA: YqaJ viral recombinase family protein [Actinomycetota bacterium]
MTEEANDDARREFVEQQASGLGATDAAKILGLSRWGTPLTVYNRIVHGDTGGQMSLSAWLGLKLERVVGEMYTTKTGQALRVDNKHHRRPGYDWQVAHLDFRARGNPKLLVECKTRAYATGYGEDGTGEIPADVYVQVQHEMAVTGAERCDVAVLIGHHTFNVYPIPRADDFIDKMTERLEAFWLGNIVAKVPPLPTGHDMDSDYVKRKHPDHDDLLKPATPEQILLANRLRVARDTVKEAETQRSEVENLLKDIIGDAAGLTGPFGEITWKKSRDSESVDWEQVAITYGSVIEDLFTIANPGDDPEVVARLGRAQSVYGTAVGLATTTKPGSRRFLASFKKD